MVAPIGTNMDMMAALQRLQQDSQGLKTTLRQLTEDQKRDRERIAELSQAVTRLSPLLEPRSIEDRTGGSQLQRYHLNGHAQARVLNDQELLVHILQFVAFDRQHGLCASVSGDFRSACQARKISLLLVSRYNTPFLHQYEAIQDDLVLQRTVRSMVRLHESKRLHMQAQAQAAQAVGQDALVRHGLHKKIVAGLARITAVLFVLSFAGSLTLGGTRLVQALLTALSRRMGTGT